MDGITKNVTILLNALLANPHDQDLRLAYAGAIEDGKLELPAVDLRGGEVVHDQYGVPLLVRCTMATWCGEECNNCNGSGEVYVWPGDIITPMDCRRCKGTGRIPGIAAAVCGVCPITGVELTDRPITKHGQSRYRISIDLANVLGGDVYIGPYRSKAKVEQYQSDMVLRYGRRATGLPDLTVVPVGRHMTQITPPYGSTFHGQPR